MSLDLQNDYNKAKNQITAVNSYTDLKSQYNQQVKKVWPLFFSFFFKLEIACLVSGFFGVSCFLRTVAAASKPFSILIGTASLISGMSSSIA